LGNDEDVSVDKLDIGVANSAQHDLCEQITGFNQGDVRDHLKSQMVNRLS
jgi:hypothetical protein